MLIRSIRLTTIILEISEIFLYSRNPDSQLCCFLSPCWMPDLSLVSCSISCFAVSIRSMNSSFNVRNSSFVKIPARRSSYTPSRKALFFSITWFWYSMLASIFLISAFSHERASICCMARSISKITSICRWIVARTALSRTSSRMLCLLQTSRFALFALHT